MSANPPVTVCLPVYQAQEFIGPTLDSVRQQTFDGLRILISIDPSTDASERLCRRAAAEDSRIDVVVQETRRGWVGNLNSLLDRVDSEWFFFMPHDDLLSPDYVEALYAAAADNPHAINVFSDIRRVGLVEDFLTSRALDGSLVDRVFAFFSEELSAHPFRGLTRRQVLDAGVRVRDNPYRGFAADVAFVLETLCHGPFQRVPRTLFQRHERAGSVVRGWLARPREWRLAALVEHFAVVFEILDAAPITNDDRALLQAAALTRLASQFQIGSDHYTDGQARGHESLVLISALLARVRAGSPLRSDELRRLEGDRRLQRLVAEVRVREAHTAIASGDWPAAQSLIAAALSLDDDNAEAHRLQGIALRKSGRLPEGRRELERAAKLAPDDLGALTALADALAADGQLEPAGRLLHRAVELYPDSAAAQAQLSHVLLAEGDLTQATQRAHLAVELDAEAQPYREHLAHLEDLERD